ncbi:MAG TPA: tyrosine/phenylalanine carboxypeptidase domain-containing protein [Lacipirellulaceae bacterium]|nr:tyrosine/phenylalanine carboxypeptidase domain-containing protein [Lacipirellulaceae bacterium]
MPTESPQEIAAAFDSIAAAVRDRLSHNQRIRRTLPGDGRLRLDRQLPFLCIYRAPAGEADPGTRELVTTEAAYLFFSSRKAVQAGAARLIDDIIATLREHFGAFLTIEFWAEDDRPASISPRDATRPGFRIVAAEAAPPDATIQALETALREVHSQGWKADVTVERRDDAAPPGRTGAPWATPATKCCYLGIAVRPVYRDRHTGVLFPVVLQSLRRQLAAVVRRTVFAFTGQQSGVAGAHYDSLGPSALVKAARLVDQQLSEVSQAFDFVLQTVPLNSAVAWEEFAASGYRTPPRFYYRPLPYDPALLKRRLYEIPVDRIEDVALIHLFQQKQDHLDRQLTALKNIDLPPFFYDAVQLYGQPDAALVQLARGVLARTVPPVRSPETTPPENAFRTDEIVAAARDQIDHYHQCLPGFVATVHVRNDLASTMMVAQDRLLVAASASLPPHALAPLLHHEVGTHLLTYFNGRQQPFQQLYAGLAGYEELQEGMAVLAEFLVGGLTRLRIRTIACRVLAVQGVVEGRSFVDTFHQLHGEHGLAPKAAFMTTLRAFRGGGLTKDAIYLRGLQDLLDYLRQGHDLQPLYVGKIALGHVPLVQELRRRGIIGPPALLPSFLDHAETTLRLDQCRRYSLLELVERLP